MVHCCGVQYGRWHVKTIFWFAVSSRDTHSPSFFTFPICFKCQTTIEWLMVSSWATSCVVVRGSASIMISVGCCQLPMANHWLLIFKVYFPVTDWMFVSLQSSCWPSLMASGINNPPANAGDSKDVRVQFLGRKDPLLPTPVFLPGKFPWTEETGGLQSIGLQRIQA